MPSRSATYKRFVDKSFREIVGPVAEKNGFKFRTYTYYRAKNGMLQSFALQNCSVGRFEVAFFVSPTSLGLTGTGSGYGLEYFNRDNKYHMSVADYWDYTVRRNDCFDNELEKIISHMNEIKEIIEERLIPFFDGLTDDRALLSFYKKPLRADIDNYREILNLYLKLEEYDEAEKMLRHSIESIITMLYNDMNGLSEHPWKWDGRGYLFHFNIAAKEALMLKNLEEKNYDFFREMIKENEKITEEFLKHPKFDRL